MNPEPSPRRTRWRTREELQKASTTVTTTQGADISTTVETSADGALNVRTIISNTRITSENTSQSTTAISASTSVSVVNNTPPLVNQLSGTLKAKQIGIPTSELRILHIKQQWLRNHTIEIPLSNPHPRLHDAVNATLVFAQEEAGTAICISPNGLLLTCSHCIAETPAELRKTKFKWLLFSCGQVVKAGCIAWDPRRDLALLKIVAAQSNHDTNSVGQLTFPSISLASEPPPPNTPLLCIGHPGSEDLESSTPGQKTNYDVIHVSKGKFHGYVADQDPQDNSEIGALQHNCWTYWGHSGAPLVERKTGGLVGLHSSWDENTGMRRGVGWEALKEFLQENNHSAM